MKHLVILFAVALFAVLPSLSVAQIPNAGFELWTGFDPDGWLVNNTVQFQAITQTSTAHSGSFAAKGTVIDIGFGVKLYPILVSGIDGVGFPIAVRYGSLQGYFQLSPESGDNLYITCLMKKAGVPIAAGIFTDSLAAASYQQFSVPIEYSTSDIPDTAIISVLIFGPHGTDYHIGSYFYLDDLSFSGAVSVVTSPPGIPSEFSLRQNYPNPFNPGTAITYTLPSQSHVSIRITNILGQEVQTLVDEVQPAGERTVTWNADRFPSGVYLYRIDAMSTSDPMRTFSAARRMLLLK
jgi:hypothetical protein